MRSEALRNWTQSNEATVAAQCGRSFLRHMGTTSFSIQIVVAHKITSPAVRLLVDRAVVLTIKTVNSARNTDSVQKKPRATRSPSSDPSSVIFQAFKLVSTLEWCVSSPYGRVRQSREMVSPSDEDNRASHRPTDACQALGSRSAGVNLRCFFNTSPVCSCVRKSLRLYVVGASLDMLAVGGFVEPQPIIFCYGSENPHGGLHGLEPTRTGHC